jgi:hypothetical protein
LDTFDVGVVGEVFIGVILAGELELFELLDEELENGTPTTEGLIRGVSSISLAVILGIINWPFETEM